MTKGNYTVSYLIKENGDYIIKRERFETEEEAEKFAEEVNGRVSNIF